MFERVWAAGALSFKTRHPRENEDLTAINFVLHSNFSLIPAPAIALPSAPIRSHIGRQLLLNVALHLLTKALTASP